ncbi:MAG: hypothetical protein LBV47_01120 [Bacteroidales bacterium]|jgi:hypothetical protein|nr:hypothetical protein [Bacteroidales bacterium]
MKNIFILLFVFFSFFSFSQDLDSEVSEFVPYIQALHDFTRHIPQEKVYLHFDNTSYYQGDNIWFKCYVVTSGQHQLSPWSKTLYVELLSPGGETIDRRILKIENGQCHGEFTLNQLTFYSGFYEVRAYTKYMLNFGDDVIFSRLLPVFDKPNIEGDFEEKNMLSYGRFGPDNGGRPMKREYPAREKAVNLRFFPEGGNLIRNVESRVAFEATDEAGNPVEVAGVVINAAGQELSKIVTMHEGRGVFTYTPNETTGKKGDVAEIEYSGKKYRFDLPAGLPNGVLMEVDNLSYTDSIGITLRKNEGTLSEMLGVAVLNGGKLQNYCFVWIEENQESFKMDKARLPAGVSQIVLFNSKGEIISDRLVFTANSDSRLQIEAKAGKQFYMPYEQVEMEFFVTGMEGRPVNTTFSLAIRDGANEVEGNRNILTDLLLMSEINGYVRNPSYYFEDGEDNTRNKALDLLLMVQGWRRYSWNLMAGIEPLDLKYLPEQGIEIKGNVVSFIKQKPQPNVNVSMVLYESGTEEEQGTGAVASFETDSVGRFSFLSGVSGKWNMFLSVADKRKQKNNRIRILLDRGVSPEPRRYNFADLQTSIAEKSMENIIDNEETPQNEDNEYSYNTLLAAYRDSLSELGIDEKMHNIPEVTVKAKRRMENEVFENRSTSVAYYDVASESDNIYDRGEIINNDIHALLYNMNQDFFTIRGNSLPMKKKAEPPIQLTTLLPMPRDESSHSSFNEELLYYKHKLVLFILNYKAVEWSNLSTYLQYKDIDVGAIKSIYINDNPYIMADYIYVPPQFELLPIEVASELVGCAVFIETYPEGEIPVKFTNGVRQTWLEGYSNVAEFYSPNYTVLPPEPDYRRTLYWNPAVTTDENGRADIKFYNNSSGKNFSISAETVTPLGMAGVYKSK